VVLYISLDMFHSVSLHVAYQSVFKAGRFLTLFSKFYFTTLGEERQATACKFSELCLILHLTSFENLNEY